MKLRYKIIIRSVILALILACVVYFFNKLYLTKILTSKFSTLLKEQLQRQVEIKNVSFGLFTGIVIQEITIFDELPSYAPILKLNSLSLKISFLPFWKDKKLNIPLSIQGSGVELFIQRKKDNTFNILNLIPQTNLKKEGQSRKNKTPTKSKLNIIPLGLDFKDINLNFVDNFVEPQFVTNLYLEELSSQFNLPLNLYFNLQGTLKPQNTTLNIKGNFSPLTKLLSASLNLNNLALEKFNPYYTNLPFSVKQTTLETANLDMEVPFKEKSLFLKLTSSIKDVHIEKDKLTLRGKSILRLDANYDFSKKDILYQGNLNLIETELSGINFLKDINNIQGEIKFSKDLLETNNLTGIIYTAPVILKGRLSDFANPYLYLNFLSDFDLSVLRGLLGDKLKDNSLQFQGNSKLDLTLEGYLKEKKPLNYHGALNISQGEIISPTLKEPLQITQTEIKLKDNIISLDEIKAKYKDSNLDARLSIDLTNFNNAKLSSQGKINLELADLNSLSEDNLDLRGLVKGTFNLDTKLNALNNGSLDLKASSNEINIKGIKFLQPLLQYTQANKEGKLNILSLNTYDGKTQIFLEIINPMLKEMTYKGNVEAKDIDLAKLKLDTPWKDKEFAGILNSQIELKGQGINLSTLEGQGVLEIKKGNLWQITLLKDLATFLKLPGFENIIFDEASGVFFIKDQKVTSKKFTLKSNQVDFIFEGDIGFDKKLNLIVNAQIIEQLVEQSEELKKLTSIGLFPFRNLIGVKITGTLDKPKPKLAVDLDIFKKVKGLLGDIFE